MNPMMGGLGIPNLSDQIENVKASLGLAPPHKGNAKKGNGWGDNYLLYCVRCNLEIQKAFIDEKDPKRIPKCPGCKMANELWKREDRVKHMQRNMDLLEQEEINMKARKKRWKKYRKKYPLSGVLNDDEKELPYKESSMWVSDLDFDEYLDNEYYIPRNINFKKVTDRAWDLHAKYQICKKQMDKANKEKQAGNIALKAGNYDKAIKHYTQAIRERTDYKVAYTNRALAYMKLGNYDKCIADCTVVIEMIRLVDTDLLKADQNFKAYLRRANAYKLQEKYEIALKDLTVAVDIKPNDGSVKKLLSDTKRLNKRVKIRFKLQQQMLNDVSLNDFDSVFNLSIDFLQEATSNEEFDYETGHSEELLRRLLIFVAKNKKYCVRFADNNGIELCLKYLRKKFKILKKFKEKMNSLSNPLKLLNYCCAKDVNFNELKDQKLKKLIGIIILYTYGYFADMTKELQNDSMRFVAVTCSIAHIRDFVTEKHGNKLIKYFIKFQKKTNPAKQDPRSIRCLFESLSYLCQTETFQSLLCKQINPYCYEIFFHSMFKYVESKPVKSIGSKKNKKKGVLITKSDIRIMNDTKKKELMAYEQLQFAISVLLDGLAMVFDGGRKADPNKKQGLPDPNKSGQQKLDEQKEDKKRLEMKEKMCSHFISNKNIEKYMILLTEYFHSTTKKFKEYNNNIGNNNDEEKNKTETQRYFGQLGKCMNVFVSLSRTLITHPVLFKYSIHRDCISLTHIVKDGYRTHPYPKMKPMLKITRNNILTYFDQLSNDVKFDEIFSNSFDNNILNAQIKKLPTFWKFICDIFVEEYNDKPHPVTMQTWAHYKSCCIRLLYRWSSRRADATKPLNQRQKINIPSPQDINDTYLNQKKISYLLELMIFKYFNLFFDWLKYNDLQVLANTPLVIRQCMIYAVNIKQEKRTKSYNIIKKSLNLNNLKLIMRLMQAPHDVIQYNSCLLMAQINEFGDIELSKTIDAMGALAILEAFNRAQQQRQMMYQQQQQQQNINNSAAIGYK